MCGPCWALDNLLMDVREVNRKDELVPCPAGRLVMPGTLLSHSGLRGDRLSESKGPRAKQIPRMHKDTYFLSPRFQLNLKPQSISRLLNIRA